MSTFVPAVFDCVLWRFFKSLRGFKSSTDGGRQILLLSMICICQTHKGTDIREKKSQEEELETLHRPQFHLNKAQSSEMSHSINTVLKNAANIISDKAIVKLKSMPKWTVDTLLFVPPSSRGQPPKLFMSCCSMVTKLFVFVCLSSECFLQLLIVSSNFKLKFHYASDAFAHKL